MRLGGRRLALLVIAGALLTSVSEVGAQGEKEAPPSAGELAKQLANPIASLVSVPFQSNWDFRVGADEDTRYLLNFQPVMPLPVNLGIGGGPYLEAPLDQPDWRLRINFVLLYPTTQGE